MTSWANTLAARVRFSRGRFGQFARVARIDIAKNRQVVEETSHILYVALAKCVFISFFQNQLLGVSECGRLTSYSVGVTGERN